VQSFEEKNTEESLSGRSPIAVAGFGNTRSLESAKKKSKDKSQGGGAEIWEVRKHGSILNAERKEKNK